MVERYIYRRGPDYYSNPHLLAKASGRSWAGFLGSLASRELISERDVSSDGFFKEASLSQVLYFKNNPHLVAALCARQLSERSTLLQRARILKTSEAEEKVPPESSPWPFALKLREAVSSWIAPWWIAPRWLAPVGLLIAEVGLSLQVLKPPSALAQASIPTPVILDELVEKRAKAVAVQLPNLDDLIQDAVNISAEQLEVSIDSLDPATLRAVNIRVRNIVEGISNLVINGAFGPGQSDEIFKQLLNSGLVRNYLRVTIFRHMADDLKETESAEQINRTDLTVNLLKKTAKHGRNLQGGLIYLTSRGFSVEDLDFVITTAEKWGLIQELDGPVLVDLMAEYNQEVSDEDSVVGRRSILRALLNKHLRVFDHDTNFQNRLKLLMTSLASILTQPISFLLK